MAWIIRRYDRSTDRDGEEAFTTEAAFLRAADDLLHNKRMGFDSAVLPDGTLVKGEGALRALIAAGVAAR